MWVPGSLPGNYQGDPSAARFAHIRKLSAMSFSWRRAA